MCSRERSRNLGSDIVLWDNHANEGMLRKHAASHSHLCSYTQPGMSDRGCPSQSIHHPVPVRWRVPISYA